MCNEYHTNTILSYKTEKKKVLKKNKTRKLGSSLALYSTEKNIK